MNDANLIAEHENCKSRLQRLTDDLAAIADWKEELKRKIRLARLKFELVDCFDKEEEDALAAEVEALKQVCTRLGETMTIDEDNSERKAA